VPGGVALEGRDLQGSPTVNVTVVTGASSGVGRATVDRLIDGGHRIVAIARREERLRKLEETFGRDLVVGVPADVCDIEALRSALATLPETHTDISAVVNNAGLSRGFGTIDTGKIDDWREMVGTNIGGALNVVHLLTPHFVARGGGHVVNIGSIAAYYPYMGGNVYAATKAFLMQLSLNMRADLEGTSVRVTLIAPGMIRTEFALVRFDGDAGRADRLYEGLQPLSAEDVAESVVWSLAQPGHVNINLIELMATDQPFGLSLTASNRRSEAPAAA
jgi:3-hydroxy acid dehydrogenase/malonic semialdehyde reductase